MGVVICDTEDLYLCCDIGDSELDELRELWLIKILFSSGMRMTTLFAREAAYCLEEDSILARFLVYLNLF
jgi:hypothetical protein